MPRQVRNKTRMTDEFVAVLENRKINQKYFKLIFKSSALARNIQPGQFLQIQVEAAKDPFLRRPFSYYRISDNCVEILYEILGCGTALLSQKKKGDILRVMGPLGRPFSKETGKKIRILVAGGIGIPPLIFLAERYGADYLLIGVKSKKELLPRIELKRIKSKILYSSDDGSRGVHGYVTLLLEKILAEKSGENLFIQTCGPNRMMQEVIKIAKSRKIEGEASLDERMACGVGACLGCMVKTNRGWVASCKEGPVFNFSELID